MNALLSRMPPPPAPPLVGDADSAVSVVSVLAAAHSSGAGLLSFFTARESRALALVHRELHEAVRAFPWADPARVTGSLALWRAAFAFARAKTTSSSEAGVRARSRSCEQRAPRRGGLRTTRRADRLGQQGGLLQARRDAECVSIIVTRA